MKIAPNRLSSLRAFSLIELLVGVLIIAILALLLLAAGRSVLARSRQTQCAAHLRSLGIAFQSYAADNGGILPVFDYWRGGSSPDSQGKYWYAIVAPYVGVGDSAAVWRGDQGASAVWYCPAIHRLRKGVDRDTAKPDYGINMEFAQLSPTNLVIGARSSNIKNASQKVLLFCSARRYGSYSRAIIESFGPGIGWGDLVGDLSNQSHFCQIHSGRANVLFVDGHVESHTFPEIDLEDMWK